MVNKSVKKLILKPIPPSSEILRQRSKNVPIDKIKSKEIQDLIDAIIQYSNETQGDGKKRTMVGASASQFGILKRISLIDTKATGIPGEQDLQIFINPEIIYMSEEVEDGREGCFSTGMVCGIVSRSKVIKIRGYNRHGELIEETYMGFPARIFQHELDHFEGICFPDRITDDKKLHWVEPEEFGDYRINWSTWDKLCPRDRWEAIKFGKDSDK